MIRFTRIFRNAGLLWLQHLLSMVAELWIVRVVMRSVGADGYGLLSSSVSVVAVAFLLSGTLYETFVRYLSAVVEDSERQAACFFSTLRLAVASSVLFGLVAEIIGSVCLARCCAQTTVSLASVLVIYQSVVASAVIGLLQMPFMALVCSREQMHVLASVNASESLLTLAAVTVASRLSATVGPDVFAIIMVVAKTLTFGWLVLYLRTDFFAAMRTGAERCRFAVRMCVYSGWSSLRSIANRLKYDGTGLLVTFFAGFSANAGWGLALKVGFFMNFFVCAIRDACVPQLVACWVKGDAGGFRRLIFVAVGCSLGVSLMLSIPIIAFARHLADIWIGERMPPIFISFVRILALHFILDSASVPLHAAILAKERIAGYQVVVSFLMASGFVFAGVMLVLGLPVWAAAVGLLVSNLLSLVYRVRVVARMFEVGAIPLTS